MRVAVLEQVSLPTARAIRWAPFAGASGLLLVMTLLARASDRPVDSLLAIASAVLASLVVGALHDPAADLLAAVPVSAAQRRTLRLALVLLPALATWWVLTLASDASPGAGSPGPLLALTATGVAAAVWSPAHAGALVGASVPLLWFALDVTVPGTAILSDVAGLWHTAPGPVLVVALVGFFAGGRR